MTRGSRASAGCEARAGLNQGVPCKEPHHLLHLLDQITGFAARQCLDPLFRDATNKIVKRVAVRQAGKQDLLHPYLRKVLFEPCSPASSCCLGQGCCHAVRCNGVFQLSKYILRHNLLIFALFILINFSNFFQHRKQCSF